MSTKDRRVGSRDRTSKAPVDGTRAHCDWPIVRARDEATPTRKELELQKARELERLKKLKKPGGG